MKIVSLFICLLFLRCSSTMELKQPEIKSDVKNYHPSGTEELILDKNLNEVQISEKDDIFFRSDSKNKSEYYRVILSSDSYQIRQIRGSEELIREPDSEGDKLISESIQKYDKIDFEIYGTLKLNFNIKLKNVKSIQFTSKVPRINEIAKIMQDDLVRWFFEFKNEEINLRYILISYKVILKKKLKKSQ